jgi:glycosyltransferase involved in cell wall biosynthesis
VVHAHELAGSTRRFTAPRDLAVLRSLTTRWIAVSEAGREHLLRELGIDSERIALVRNFVPPRKDPAPARPDAKARLAARHALPGDAPWIVAVGNLDPVKAPERFLAVAEIVLQTSAPSCVFAWIGGGLRTAFGRQLIRAARRGTVHFVGPCDDPRPWFLASEMLLVTSNEESGSLVALEAAQCGTPTIAFAGTGGIDEFLRQGAGELVAERSADAMAAAVVRWLQNPAEMARARATASARVRTEADYECQCEAIASVLETLPRNRPA